jgi:hypothetical protein
VDGGIAEPRASGAMLLNTWVSLRALVGADTYARALASLDDAVRQEIEQATAISWVRMSASNDLINAASRLSGSDPELIYDEVIKRSVQLTFGGVWRVLIRFATPETLVTRAALLYSKSRDTGKLTASLIRPGYAELRVTEWPRMSERYIRGIGITSKALLLMSGEKIVSHSHATTRDGGLIRVRWGAASPP